MAYVVQVKNKTEESVRRCPLVLNKISLSTVDCGWSSEALSVRALALINAWITHESRPIVYNICKYIMLIKKRYLHEISLIRKVQLLDFFTYFNWLYTIKCKIKRASEDTLRPRHIDNTIKMCFRA